MPPPPPPPAFTPPPPTPNVNLYLDPSTNALIVAAPTTASTPFPDGSDQGRTVVWVSPDNYTNIILPAWQAAIANNLLLVVNVSGSEDQTIVTSTIPAPSPAVTYATAVQRAQVVTRMRNYTHTSDPALTQIIQQLAEVVNALPSVPVALPQQGVPTSNQK